MMEIVVVGHLSRDLLITPERRRETLGGGTAYAMLAPALGALGAGIVTRVGADFEQEYLTLLRNSGLDLTGLRVSGPHTTRFVNEYDKEGNRTQRVEHIAPPLRSEDYMGQHLDVSITHFCPLTSDDIHPSCIEVARMHGSLTSLDVQGYLRRIDDGEVRECDWQNRDAVLRYVDVVKADQRELLLAVQAKSEISAVTKIMNLGPRIIVVTRDRKGSTIYTRNTQVDIPLVLADKFVDTTGSGDTYMIGFLLEYFRSGDIRRSGLFGATCASFNLETIGPYDLPDRKQVEERMKMYL
ncbi:carbohydrate kinase family protein [Candidatus Thorarchaeota archaeon]|nr:MAG: carbohydrate kinase family protein [Candidatus Thorarchaeota archaeon]